MIWFIVGALLGAIQMGVSVSRRPIPDGYPVQGMLVASALGAALYGSVLWLIATFAF